jgi:Probable sensor domain DACNV
VGAAHRPTVPATVRGATDAGVVERLAAKVAHWKPKLPVRAEHAYPSDLAALVLHRWEEALAAGRTDRMPPDAAALTSVLSTCYHATLLREEGRPVTFRLAVSDPEAFDPAAGPPTGLHRLLFTRCLPLDPHELRRLSPAAVFSRSLIGATLTSPGAPEMWGMIHSGLHWLQPVRGGRAREQAIPHVLIIAATGPGRLLVSIGEITLAELKSGTLSGVEMDLFQSCWVQDRLGEMGRLYLTEQAHRADGGSAATATAFASKLAGHVLRRMLATVRASQHGGTLIVIPEHRARELLSDGRHLRVKYGFTDEEPRRRIVTLVRAIMDEVTRFDPDGTTLRWETDQASAIGQLGELDEALFDVAHLLANLTHVDGTVLITDSLEVLGFGVEIAGELPEVTRVARALDLEGSEREWVRTDRVGTRHRSAYRLCQALHDALALVVSQDGALHFIRWHIDGVAYWEQVATGPFEI